MALIRQDMVASATGTDDLELVAPTGHGFIVKSIKYYKPTSISGHFKVKIEQKLLFDLYAHDDLYLSHTDYTDYNEAFFARAWDDGLLNPIPVAEGEKLTVTAPGANNAVELVYDDYEAADVDNTAINGSKSNAYNLLQVISNSSAFTSSGDVPLDQSRLSSVLPAFPGGAVVPANHRISLKAISGIGWAKGDGAANAWYTTNYKFVKEREDIFDRDLAGIVCLGDYSRTAATVAGLTFTGRLNAKTGSLQSRYIKLDPPIEFSAGEELNVYATVVLASGSVDADEIQLVLVMDVTKE